MPPAHFMFVSFCHIVYWVSFQFYLRSSLDDGLTRGLVELLWMDDGHGWRMVKALLTLVTFCGYLCTERYKCQCRVGYKVVIWSLLASHVWCYGGEIVVIAFVSTDVRADFVTLWLSPSWSTRHIVVRPAEIHIRKSVPHIVRVSSWDFSGRPMYDNSCQSENICCGWKLELSLPSLKNLIMNNLKHTEKAFKTTIGL